MYESIDPVAAVQSQRYVVVIRSANAPKCNGGQYRRPVHVRVLDTERCNPSMNGEVGAVKCWRNVDSRYDGPRSEHGQAIRAARELAAALNARDGFRDYGVGI